MDSIFLRSLQPFVSLPLHLFPNQNLTEKITWDFGAFPACPVCFSVHLRPDRVSQVAEKLTFEEDIFGGRSKLYFVFRICKMHLLWH